MADADVVSEPESRPAARLKLLAELADMGMGLARTVAAQAADPDLAPLAAESVTQSFARLARAVRQTLALEARFERDGEQTRLDRVKRQAAETLDRGARRKQQVRRLTADVIEATATTDNDRETLLDDLYERLDDRDDLEFADRPIADLIASVCKTLGVTPDLGAFDDEIAEIEGAERRAAWSNARLPPLPVSGAGWPTKPDG